MKRGNEKKVPDFKVEKMEKFSKEDRMISFVFKDLSQRNPKLSKKEIWQVVFNSYVLEDSIMIDIYDNL